MFRFVLSFVVVAAAFAIPANEPEGISANFEIVDDISAFDLTDKIVRPLQLEVHPTGTIRYTLGNRQSGDRLVAQGGDGRQWSSPQNVQLKLRYPASGTAAVVTYVEIIVDQSSNEGRGYVIEGGIGQRAIGIVIEAQNTVHINYQAAIYGV